MAVPVALAALDSCERGDGRGDFGEWRRRRLGLGLLADEDGERGRPAAPDVETEEEERDGRGIGREVGDSGRLAAEAAEAGDAAFGE